MNIKINLIFKSICEYILITKSLFKRNKFIVIKNKNFQKGFDIVYSIPIGWISKRIDFFSSEIIKILNEIPLVEYGLNYLNKDENNEFNNLFNQLSLGNQNIEKLNASNNLNFNSALELLKNKSIEFDFNHEFLDIYEDDLKYGFIQINNLFKFIEKALELFDLDYLIQVFNWKNFEKFISYILLENDYFVVNNFRFSLKNINITKNSVHIISKTTRKLQKRFEIDIVGVKNNFILFIDAKYWANNKDLSSELSKASLYQKKRVELISSNKNSIELLFEKLMMNPKYSQYSNSIQKLKSFKLYPIIVHTNSNYKKISDYGIPLVPINQFTNFIQDFNENMDKYCSIELKDIQIQTILK